MTVNGELKVDKKDVHLHLTGNTKIPDLKITEVVQITSEDFDGEVGTITVSKELGTDQKIVIHVPAETVVVDGRSSISIESDVKTVEIGEDAEGTKVKIDKDAAVENLVADAKVTLTGKGKIENLEANASGIKVSNALDVDNTETAEGVRRPTISGTSGGSGSNRPSDDNNSTVEIVEEKTVANTEDFKKAIEECKAGNALVLTVEQSAELSEDVTATFAGTKLTINFNDVDMKEKALQITVPNATKITLTDNGEAAEGTEIGTLEIDAPNADVECTLQVETVNIIAVKDGTFTAKDIIKNATIQKGTLEILNGTETAVTIPAEATAPVTVKGTVTVKEIEVYTKPPLQ